MTVSLYNGETAELNCTSLADSDEILINLKWNSSPKKQNSVLNKLGIFKGTDLDIGCFFELKNGKKGVIQALDESFGALKRPPYVALDRDDRTGMSETGETLIINGGKISEIKRILVYAFIYKGAAHWKQADATVTVKCPRAEDIVIKTDSFKSRKKMCGLVLFENIDGENLSVQKIAKLYNGHFSLDRAFDWGLSWEHGHKQ